MKVPFAQLKRNRKYMCILLLYLKKNISWLIENMSRTLKIEWALQQKVKQYLEVKYMIRTKDVS